MRSRSVCSADSRALSPYNPFAVVLPDADRELLLDVLLVDERRVWLHDPDRREWVEEAFKQAVSVSLIARQSCEGGFEVCNFEFGIRTYGTWVFTGLPVGGGCAASSARVCGEVKGEGGGAVILKLCICFADCSSSWREDLKLVILYLAAEPSDISFLFVDLEVQ